MSNYVNYLGEPIPNWRAVVMLAFHILVIPAVFLLLVYYFAKDRPTAFDYAFILLMFPTNPGLWGTLEPRRRADPADEHFVREFAKKHNLPEPLTVTKGTWTPSGFAGGVSVQKTPAAPLPLCAALLHHADMKEHLAEGRWRVFVHLAPLIACATAIPLIIWSNSVLLSMTILIALGATLWGLLPHFFPACRPYSDYYKEAAEKHMANHS
jgi:hypothetical protein